VPIRSRGLLRIGVVSAILLVLPSCQAIQLENHTIRQVRTLSDLQYRQVMDNLAMMAGNPSSLPFFAAAGSGKTSIQATPNVNNAVNWDLITVAGSLFNKFIFDKGSITTQYTQQDLEEWDTTPSLDPIQLYLMQGLYRKALGLPIPKPQLTAMEEFFSPPATPKTEAAQTAHPLYKGVYAEAMQDLYRHIAPGFLNIGRKCDVPENACYVGHHCGRYVWVTADGLEGLTNLTIAIIDAATIDTSTLTDKPRVRTPSSFYSATPPPPA
jgi:hypothetical protein